MLSSTSGSISSAEASVLTATFLGTGCSGSGSFFPALWHRHAQLKLAPGGSLRHRKPLNWDRGSDRGGKMAALLTGTTCASGSAPTGRQRDEETNVSEPLSHRQNRKFPWKYALELLMEGVKPFIPSFRASASHFSTKVDLLRLHPTNELSHNFAAFSRTTPTAAYSVSSVASGLQTYNTTS